VSRSTRSWLYWSARRMGDVQAVERGGVKGGAKRYARRCVYRKTNGCTHKLCKALGLW
jgi:hypothetical protein